ncbi:hypothetical protein ACVWZ4_001216 [Bradyrhizobium sp. USDA 4472]
MDESLFATFYLGKPMIILDRKVAALVSAACCFMVGGCGTYLPDIVAPNEPHATAFLINRILNHAKCELRDAVIAAHNNDLKNALRCHTRRLTWLDKAKAKITIKLIAEEKGSLNPGLSFKQLLPSATTNFSNRTSISTPQSTALGLGGLLQADATRTENIDYTYDVAADFLNNQTHDLVEPRPCIEKGGIFLDADLKVQDWLDGATLPFLISANVPSEVGTTAPDVLTHEANFVAMANGNITPSWTLVNVSANTAANLIAAGRTTTGDIIISLGAPSKVPQAHDIAKLNSGFTAAVKSGS